ncbi:MAG: PEP-CTERM sorting domain-containing protein [Methylococcaceae bacterium]|nr:PEP-CTERM sorting domain-containing protein [Methylococcaceae bacterium]
MKLLKKPAIAFLATFVFFVFAASSAHAVPITGGISLAGGYTPVNGSGNPVTNLTQATGIQFAPGPNFFVASTSGSFAQSISGIVSFPSGINLGHINSFTFSPNLALTNPLWTVTGISAPNLTASFNLLSIGLPQASPTSLLISGLGILNLTGFTPTAGTWVFTANQTSGTFSWSSSNGAVAVPEPGSLFLLGSSLFGLYFFRYPRNTQGK